MKKKVINNAEVMNLKEWNSLKHHAKMDDLSEFPEEDRTHKGSHSLRKGMTKHISRGPTG
jgi:hypothetical protein